MADATDPARWLSSSAGARALDAAVLRVRGEDARTWLSGQVTNDTRGLSEGGAVYALVLDGRGKILADVWVLDAGEELRLVVPGEAAEALREHFDKYIVMEDVELVTTGEVVLTVQGPRAGEVVDRAGLRGFPCDRLGTTGQDVLVEAADRDRAQAALVAAAEAIGGGEVDDAAWELGHLRAGRPRFGVDFGPANYPQEAGLKRIAVSFEKGCYLGQEVVCTLESRGQLSRHLVRIESELELAAGLELTLDGQIVGHITSARRDPEDGFLALGYVKRRALTAGTTLTTTSGACAVRGLVDP